MLACFTANSPSTPPRELVTRIDANGNEQLSASEMVEWMVRLEKAHKTQDLQDVFREADRNSNGFVTLAEFARTMSLEGELVRLVYPSTSV